MSDSTIYTIGTALNRARDNDIPVQVLVEGQWLTGKVVVVDGHGVVLQSDELEHAVVRWTRSPRCASSPRRRDGPRSHRARTRCRVRGCPSRER